MDLALITAMIGTCTELPITTRISPFKAAIVPFKTFLNTLIKDGSARLKLIAITSGFILRRHIKT